MNSCRVVLIDDEADALAGLEKLLSLYCPEVSVAGTALNVIDGMKCIQKNQPDIIFLDIEMPGGNGFDLLEILQASTSRVIFVTAHDQYAIQALRFQADDYLLKPVDPQELVQAVARSLQKKNGVATTRSEYRITISDHDGVRFLIPSEVLCIRAEGRYSELSLKSGEKLLTSRNIGEFEKELSTRGFFRVHKSWLVNCAYVTQILHVDGGFVEINHAQQIELSRRKKVEFLDYMKRLAR